MTSKSPIIIALDGISSVEALKIARTLKGLVWGFKINDLLFDPPAGGKMVSKLKKFGNVFADVKLYDIPSTVARSVTRLEKSGADMITVHASGGIEMMKAALSASRGRAKILGVTILTSKSLVSKKEFLKLVIDIKKAKLDGVVCSAHELKYLKNLRLLKVIPGIRPKWYTESDDQSRKATPQEAIKSGADYLIIGRPIIRSKDPVGAVSNLLEG